MRKSTKHKEKQFVDMKTLTKIIIIVSIYTIPVQKESLLNKKSIDHKKTNYKTCITTFGLFINMLFSHLDELLGLPSMNGKLEMLGLYPH